MRQWAGIKEQDEAFERVLVLQQRSGLVIPAPLRQEEEGLVFRVPYPLVPRLSEIRTHYRAAHQSWQWPRCGLWCSGSSCSLRCVR